MYCIVLYCHIVRMANSAYVEAAAFSYVVIFVSMGMGTIAPVQKHTCLKIRLNIIIRSTEALARDG